MGPLDISDTQGPGSTNPHVTVVVVKDFYERHIAPKRSFFEPPGTDSMFRPSGALMQMALNSTEVARPGERIVYGRWSFDGTWWQVFEFIVPLVAMVAIVLFASTFW